MSKQNILDHYPKILTYRYTQDVTYEILASETGIAPVDVYMVEYTSDQDPYHFCRKHMIDEPAYNGEWYINGVKFSDPNSSNTAARRYEEAVIIWLKLISHISAEDTLRYIKRQKKYEQTYSYN